MATGLVSPALTARDVELLGHLAARRSMAQIAVAMSVTTNTARTRVRRVERKLGAAGRDQAARRARDLGLA